MTNAFLIDNTSGTVEIKLSAGEMVGPNGAPVTDTTVTTCVDPDGNARNAIIRNLTPDVRLYGLGVLSWGEGIDENFYRLMENFACSQKSNGQKIPRYPFQGPNKNDVQYEDANAYPVYDSDVHKVAPQDDRDLGAGRGVNNPVIGQLWFNTTSRLLYVYDGCQWKWAGKPNTTLPTNPQEGDLWYDTDTDQLKVYTLVAYNIFTFSTADRTFTVEEAKADRFNDSRNYPYVYVDILPVDSGRILDLPKYPLAIGNSTNTTYSGSPTNTSAYCNRDATLVKISAAIPASLSSCVHNANNCTCGTLYHFEWVSVADKYVRLDGTSVMYPDANITFQQGTITGIRDPSSNKDAVPYLFADNRYVNVAGDYMNGMLQFGTVNHVTDYRIVTNEVADAIGIIKIVDTSFVVESTSGCLKLVSRGKGNLEMCTSAKLTSTLAAVGTIGALNATSGTSYDDNLITYRYHKYIINERIIPLETRMTALEGRVTTLEGYASDISETIYGPGTTVPPPPDPNFPGIMPTIRGLAQGLIYVVAYDYTFEGKFWDDHGYLATWTPSPQPLQITFDFTSWETDYQERNPDELEHHTFMVIPIITYKLLRVGNPSAYPTIIRSVTVPRASHPSGFTINNNSMGDYPYLDFLAETLDTSPGTTINLKLGVRGFFGDSASAWGASGVDGQERPYSTVGTIHYRIWFFGGPKDKVWRYLHLPSTVAGVTQAYPNA